MIRTSITRKKTISEPLSRRAEREIIDPFNLKQTTNGLREEKRSLEEEVEGLQAQNAELQSQMRAKMRGSSGLEREINNSALSRIIVRG